MRYLKIPMERVGVIIGHNGEIKRYLEEKSNLKIDIDSEQGEVTIDDHESSDPLMVFKIENIVRAIGRGFSPEHAMKLFNEYNDLFIFDIHDYVGKRQTHIQRLKSRVIGREGKTKKIIEKLTQSDISVYGHTISIICDMDYLDVAKKAVDMLLSGSKHATVYKYIEKNMKKMKYDLDF